MAGGIDWFRWHHGSVTDPKFQLVARKSGASLPDVLAVWVWLLEKASAAEFRGHFGEVDCEALDCLFGFDDGVTDSIMAAMVDRKLIADEYIAAWEKRQPKREDDNAAERKRQQREREREAARAASVTGGESRTVTQSHAESRSDTHGHARGEERREEEKTQTEDHPHLAGGRTHEAGGVDLAQIVGGATPTQAGAICGALRRAGIGDTNPGHPRLLTLIAAGATEAEFTGFASAALSKSAGFAWVLGAVENERKRAYSASKSLHQGVMPTQPKTPAWMAASQAYGDALVGKTRRADPPPAFAMEAIDAPSRLLD
jgi:hypothetical protein